MLQISWLVADKGIGLALEAVSHALAVRSDLHFVFCGDGEGRPAYEEMAVQLGIKDHVTWTGQLRDISGSGALDAADIQIQCSQWNEAFCYAVAEGMSAHLPVIASRIGGLPELVEDGVSGLLFDPKSCAELTAAILRFAADEPLRIRMGQRGLERSSHATQPERQRCPVDGPSDERLYLECLAVIWCVLRQDQKDSTCRNMTSTSSSSERCSPQKEPSRRFFQPAPRVLP